jgi:methionyl-tRNA formyltransferase
MPPRPRILYVSCAANGLFGLRQLLAAGQDIAAVVTLPPATAARFNISGYVDFAPFCAERGLRVVSLESYTLEPVHLHGIAFDVIVVNGWNRLIREDVISLAPLGGLGVHAGHPPIGLGRAPLVWNILLGRTDIEVYVFKLTPNADDGAIVASQVVEITPQDDVRLLYEKVMLAGAGLFLRAIERVAQGRPAAPQDLSHAVHYGKRTPEDGEIDFSRSESEIYDFVRSQVPPYPGAFTWLGDVRWTVLRAVPFDRFAFRDVARVPGTILAVLPAGVVVQTGGAAVWIVEAEIGGRAVPAGGFEDLGAAVGQRFRAVQRPQSHGSVSA